MSEAQSDDIIDHILQIRKDANKKTLPGVSNRVKAAFADTVILIVFMLILSFIFAQFENVPESARIVGFIFIFVLYDPLFTSFFGGTIGHMIMNIRVKRAQDQDKNILFPLAIIRYLVKVILGWLSLLTVGRNKDSMAIHDMAVGSIVIYNKPNTEA